MKSSEKSILHTSFPGLLLFAFLFALSGLVIMVVFSPWDPILTGWKDYLGRIILISALSFASIALNRQTNLFKYHQIVMGLLIMAVAVSLDWVFSNYLLNSIGVDGNTPRGTALLKLNECFIVITTIILFTRLSGQSLRTIYLQKGNLRLSLVIGLITFCLAAATSLPAARAIFLAEDLRFEKILPWLPWIMIFVFANGALEEFLFRGLFLKKLEPFLGKFWSNFMIALVFTGLHLLTSYSSDMYIFIAILFPLAILWGYIIQRTNNLIGSILFHAGMDIPIMLGMFSQMG